jgi:hypothetical protein
MPFPTLCPTSSSQSSTQDSFRASRVSLERPGSLGSGAFAVPRGAPLLAREFVAGARVRTGAPATKLSAT